MSPQAAQAPSAPPDQGWYGGDEHAAGAAAPLCFVIDSDRSIRHFLSLILHGAGIDTQEFADAAAFRTAVARRTPDLVFLNIALESAEAIECVVTLGTKGFGGFVQLMSNRGSAVLEHVRSIGTQHGLQMLQPLKKPFDTGGVLKILHDLKLGHPPVLAARVDLDSALRKGWMEFWYQPKIDLRKKQLVGVEAFARARDPQNGVLLPSAFMPGAGESALIALSEMAVTQGLRACAGFAALGVNLRLAVNIPVNALVRLPLADIAGAHRATSGKWPGLIVGISEDQILTDLALADELAEKLRPLDIQLAIDDFGRGHSALTGRAQMPFAEFKLDRAFVNDCGTNRVNAPVCRTVIDLAHHFGSVAVGMGIEKASDALALISMGCDYGQGFLLGQPMPEERFTSLLRQRASSKGRQPSADQPAAGNAPAA